MEGELFRRKWPWDVLTLLQAGSDHGAQGCIQAGAENLLS